MIRLRVLGLFIRLLCVSLLLGSAFEALWAKEYRIDKGTLDLSDWSHLENRPTILLNGEWTFFPRQFVESGETARGGTTRMVPGTWQAEDIHFASYALHIRVDDQETVYGLKTPGYTTSCRIYVNGRLVFEGGRTASEAALEESSRRAAIIPLEKSLNYDITIQVANFIHAKGGLHNAPAFGPYELLIAEKARRISQESLIIAGFLAIGLYHLIIFAIRREKTVLFFASACIVIAIRTSFSNEQIYRLYFSLSYQVSLHIEYFSLFLVNPLCEIYLALMFKKEYPWKIFRFRLVCFFMVLSTAMLPTYQMSQALSYCHISHIMGVLICLYTIIGARMNQRLGSGLMMIGLTVFAFFALWDIANSLGFGLSGNYFLHVGFMAFVISQSGAIAQSYSYIFDRLMATEAEKNHSFEQLAKVFFSHQIAAIKQNKQLEETMPTTPGQACVLSFDIIGSSKIKHVKAKEFFRNVFSRCNEIMMEGYDGITHRSRAYRIKEMGDGFLCSIGYPFQAMTDNLANDAVDLANRFARVLHEESAMLHSEFPVTCGIGLAIDTLSGFYPESGPKEYDIFGPALVLATRYEGMRKVLFDEEKRRSIFIIQDIVYRSLDPEHRQEFQLVDLKQLGIVVRDDATATQLYYRLVDFPESAIEAQAS